MSMKKGWVCSFVYDFFAQQNLIFHLINMIIDEEDREDDIYTTR